MKLSSKENKRSETRHGCIVPVEGKQGSRYDETCTIDISRHGIGFVSPHAHQVNERVAIEIQLKADTDPVLVLGVVKWVQKLTDSDQYRIGMNFEQVLSGSQTRLNQYFKKQA